MIITKETDYALRILRVLLDGEKHSVAEMSETELIPNQFAYQILRKLSAGNLVRVSRGALGGCELSCDLDATSLYDLMGVVGERGILCACMEPGYECRWQDKHGRCAIHCQLAALQQKQDEAFRAIISAMKSIWLPCSVFRILCWPGSSPRAMEDLGTGIRI